MYDEPTKGEFHSVDNREADDAIEAMKHAIPHNEAVGRVLRNMYARIQDLEVEVANLKAKRAKDAGL